MNFTMLSPEDRKPYYTRAKAAMIRAGNDNDGPMFSAFCRAHPDRPAKWFESQEWLEHWCAHFENLPEVPGPKPAINDTVSTVTEIDFNTVPKKTTEAPTRPMVQESTYRPFPTNRLTEGWIQWNAAGPRKPITVIFSDGTVDRFDISGPPWVIASTSEPGRLLVRQAWLDAVRDELRP
jgi:hypothetical protein